MLKTNKFFLQLLLAFFTVLLVSGCATTNKDPLEGMNRVVYKFNDVTDKAVIKPVATAYKTVTPSPIRKGVTNFFSNLGTLTTVFNDLLQLKFAQAFTDAGRFVINSTFGIAGARTEIPGCSLCMGNQARVADKATVFSTSTRNFDNRMGKDARVYLGSAELAAVCAKLGRMPTPTEYLETVGNKLANTAEIYKYLNFNQMTEYAGAFDKVKKVIPITSQV
jgi:hypothetical protein